MANSLKASAKGLALVDQARRRRGWTKTSTARWWQDAHTSRATLRRFWQGERIQRDIFIALCQVVGISEWEQVADPEPELTSELLTESTSPAIMYDLGQAPDVASFYGRTQELNQLTQWIVVDRCKLVTILGMAGIGKTALALALIDLLGGGEEEIPGIQAGSFLPFRSLSSPFQRILWRSLQPAPTLRQLLDSLMHTFSLESQVHIAQDIPTGCFQLFHYLREQRCLLVLDGLEAILDHKTAFRSGYEEYSDFFLRLNQERHQSCILLTSREQPPELFSDGDRTQRLTLRGLPPSAALDLLQNQYFPVKERGLKALVRLYGGNPLALKLTAPLIQELFSGNVIAYLSQQTIVLSDRLRTLLKQQLKRLSDLERDILYWLAIWQEPIPLCRLQSHLLYPLDPAAILESLANLESRSLLEKLFHNDELLLTLQPFVMKVVSEELIEQAFQELDRAVQTHQISQFRIIRTHCLLRPGTDDIAGDLILTQLSSKLRYRGSGYLVLTLSDLLPLFLDQPPFSVGYAAHNLSALLQLLY